MKLVNTTNKVIHVPVVSQKTIGGNVRYNTAMVAVMPSEGVEVTDLTMTMPAVKAFVKQGKLRQEVTAQVVNGSTNSGDEAVNLSKMTKDNLKAYAAEHGIDLGDATTKEQIIAAIEAAQA